MLYDVTHTTTYRYTAPVSLCHNLVHLQPRGTPRQTCRQSDISVSPTPRGIQQQRDYFGNPVAIFTIEEPHRQLEISARHRIEVQPAAPIAASPAWETVRDQLRNVAAMEATAFLFDSMYIQRRDELADYAAPSFAPARSLHEAVLDLSARIHREFKYDAEATTIATPLSEVLANRHGVCQDFAHLVIGCLRSLGLAARYVSGYLRTHAPTRLVGADASHAWLSVYCGDSGWFDVDPTNNLVPSDQHVIMAWGRDYDDVSPIKGVILGGGTHTMAVAVEVKPVAQT